MADTMDTGAQSALFTARVGTEQLNMLYDKLNRYKAGKHSVERRAIAAEEWWKLHNDRRIRKDGIEQPGELPRSSGWLHNVIVSKHADAIEAYPEPYILPREEGDKREAHMLTDVLPCVLEQNDFEGIYSDEQWQKLKTGTGIFKVIWDKNKLNGLGDIAIKRISLLNLFWEPGVTDIEDSRYVFETNLVDNEILKQMYPQLTDRALGKSFVQSKFLYDDNVDTSGKSTVIDCYYKTYRGGKKILQYIQFVGDVVLYATEDDRQRPTAPVEQEDEDGNAVVVDAPVAPSMAERGLYDHGMYPYVFDALFPVEGSPCGYGYIDLGRDAQEEIDVLGKAIADNAVASATPRYFVNESGKVNENEFMDFRKPLVHVNGMVDASDYMAVTVPTLPAGSVNYRQQKIDELRQITGNTEAATGVASNSVTAASAIAALQEASGKGSRASTLGSYNACRKIFNLCIELIRQFYDLPRTFRIVGQYGADEFVQYDNSGLQLQQQTGMGGADFGFRLPVFDIKVGAQKKNTYTKLSQNELALQLYQLGFFNVQNVDQALGCLDMMDFDDKDELMRKLSQGATIYNRMIEYQKLAITLAMQYRPDLVEGLSADIQQGLATDGVLQMNGDRDIDMADGRTAAETRVDNARKTASERSQPNSGEVIAEDRR